MPLAPRTRLGPYEILGPLGAGGMGEVYRAKDTRLGRDVAVKILPAHLSSNADLRERFEREARAISSLNHPHICTLYDVGREGDADYLVMELLEGETLAARLERGPLRIDEALKIAAHIAAALAAAHKQGIVHRDLKPGNVVVTKAGAKVLDFGIAKLRDEAIVDNVTRTTPLTSQGAMLGTVQYMAPEQLEGKPVDHRADLFAFGALLYEMLTGKRAFEGQSQASVIASILKEDPRPVSQFVPTTPAALDRVVKSCLAKDPDERWQSAGDLARELRWIAEPGSSPAAAIPSAFATRSNGRERIAWILVAVTSTAAVAAMALLATRTRSTAPQGTPSRFSIGSLPNATLRPDGVNARISPDGRTLAFVASSTTGAVSLWLRPMESLSADPLAGTENGSLPFWSPDSRSLGFFGNNKLRKVPIAGGSAEILCNVGSGRGASWGSKGVIVFAPESAGPLYRVSEGGGEVAPVTVLDETRKETGHRWPWFLPDGKHFLFVALPWKQGNFDVFVGSIDSKERKLLLAATSAVIYAEPGYLIYMRDNTMVAHRFDSGRLATSGEPVSLGEAPAPSYWTGGAVVSASNNSVLTRWGMGLPNTILQWYDRTGKPIGEIPVPAGRYEEVQLSPDGGRLATVRRSSVSECDIWLLDLDRPAPSRFTFGPSFNYSITWSPDGSRIAFASDRFGPDDIFVKPTSGASEEIVVLSGGALFKEPSSWSADGTAIVFDQPDPTSGWDIHLVSQDGKSESTPFVHTRFEEREGVVSPDGKWMAYHCDESGRMELFVQSFPIPGAKYQVSSGGTLINDTRWTRDGKELMFRAGDGLTLMAVDVTTGAAFRAGAPHELFKLRSDVLGIDFAPDGERILAAVPAGQPQALSITVEMNWLAAIER